ncbi:MAG: iron-containing alcohol dehydrogenase [Acidobacteriota bacterium]
MAAGVEQEVLAMRFDSPGRIEYGAGARHRLEEVLADWGIRRPLIVTDRWMARSLPDKPGQLVYEGVQPDPTEANVAAGLEQAQRGDADGIVAFGGGSPIDCAKAIRKQLGGVKLVAVPTTAGTGSEATPVMVITDEEAGVKRMTREPGLMPDAAIVDYELSATMPRPLTAHVGVDTLTHGLEAFVSRKRHPLSEAMAVRCMERCREHLREAWRDGRQMRARAGMALAALEGGLAFGNASVALVHGMSRPLGVVFHIAHGLSNAVLLPAVTKYSWEGDAERYGEAARVLGIEPGREAFVAWLEALNRDLEVPRLRECCGGDRERFEGQLGKMARDAIASGSPANNPRQAGEDEIMAIYREAW